MQIHSKLEWNDIVYCDAPILKECFRFTFVRHPTDRFASFYRNKIQGEPGGYIAPRMTALGLYRGMPVAEVLDVMEATSAEQLDPHIVPQSWLVSLPRLKPLSYIGKLEALEEGIEEIERRTGITLQVGHENQTTARGSANALQFTPDELARVEAFYAEDFARFGYSKRAA